MKLQASDLRIGNYLIGANGEVHQLDRYGLADLCLIDWLIDDQKPIPLTEELLVKMGFTNEIQEEIPEDGELLCFFKDNIDVELAPDAIRGLKVEGVTLYNDVIDEDGQIASEAAYEVKTDIQYVHQLQNLFFALCGQELTFNK